jgi:hypothetical protein
MNLHQHELTIEYFMATGQATLIQSLEGHTVIMGHAMMGFNRDIIPTLDDFPLRQSNGVPLHDFLSQVLSGIFS